MQSFVCKKSPAEKQGDNGLSMMPGQLCCIAAWRRGEGRGSNHAKESDGAWSVVQGQTCNSAGLGLLTSPQVPHRANTRRKSLTT